MLSGSEEPWWSVSGDVTADRLLCITTLLRFAMYYKGTACIDISSYC